MNNVSTGKDISYHTKKIAYFAIALFLYIAHFFLSILVYLLSDFGVDIEGSLVKYEGEFSYPFTFFLNSLSGVALLILIAFTRKKKHLALRLGIVFLPLVLNYFLRAYYANEYGIVNCASSFREYISSFPC